MKEKIKTCTKMTIVNAMHKKLGFSKCDLKNMVSKIISESIYIIKTEDKLKIKNFGSFSVNTRKARIGRNPKTMKTTMIPERRVVSFKQSTKI